MNAVNIDASHITRRWAKNCLPPYDGISRPRAYWLRRSWKAEDLGEQGGGGSCENVLGQNLKNGGGGQAGGGETGSEVTLGRTEFPSYPTPSRTGSGRDPGELHPNLVIIIIIIKIGFVKAEAAQVSSCPFLCLNLHSSLSCISRHSFSPTFPLNLSSFAPLFTLCFVACSFFKYWYFFPQDQNDEPASVPGPPEWTDQNSLQQVVAKPFMSKVLLSWLSRDQKPPSHCSIFRCSWTARQQEILLQRFVGRKMGWRSKRILHRDRTISTTTG